MWGKRLLVATLLAAVTVSAMAFERPFPAVAKRGIMAPASYPAIVIDGATRRLTVGGRIWNQDNLIQMPASLIDQRYTVNYTETLQGDIDRIWILTPQEALHPAPAKPR